MSASYRYSARYNLSGIFIHSPYLNRFFYAGTDSGVFRSTDNGVSWAPCDSGLLKTQARIIEVNGSNLLAGMSNGLFLSTDNGISWNGAGFHDTSINAIAVSGSGLFAADGEYVSLSLD